MQTFLPYPGFEESAKVLDQQRLGKQRVETYQIMNALLLGKGWIHHPATKMWKGSERALLVYQRVIVDEWLRRGFADTCFAKTYEVYREFFPPNKENLVMPYWLGDPQFHISHQSNLVRKNSELYGQFFPGVPDDLPYYWPTSHFQERSLIMPLADNLVIEDARVMFRNFAGREQAFNSEGDRNFCVFLDPPLANRLSEEGWNVKHLRPREEEDERQAYLQVSVNYAKGRPPRVVLISSKGRTELGAEEVPMLDFADLKTADVVLNPYNWEVNGNKGIKAYLKSGFFTINEDELELKYAALDDGQDPTIPSKTVNEEVA